MERRDTISEAFERLRKAILDLLECIKKTALELVEELKKNGTAFITVPERNRQQQAMLENFQTKAILQQRQQEREVKRIEGNFNILNHDRR